MRDKRGRRSQFRPVQGAGVLRVPGPGVPGAVLRPTEAARARSIRTQVEQVLLLFEPTPDRPPSDV